MHYFENKNDEIIFETISVYQDRANILFLNSMDPLLIFFFYGIKIDNIDRYNRFFNILN
jgi:hypothetical protein